MKRWTVVLLALLFVIFIFVIKSIFDNSGDIDHTLSKGYVFLDEKYKDGIYQDKYLKYVYPGEEIYCPIEGCNVTYRVLDAYFGVLFIKELGVNSKDLKQIDEANRILGSLLALWQKERIYNTKKSTLIDKDGIALDTYCILGYIYSDKEMAKKTLIYLQGNKWLADNYYREDAWRNVADESWCVRLLIRTNELEVQRIKDLIGKKIEESEKMVSSKADISTKVATLVHSIYLIYDFSKTYKDSSFDSNLKEYQDYVYLSFDKIKNDDLLLANALDSLAYSKYDKSKLQEMADLLILRQKIDGGWYSGEDLSRDNLSVFTTIRVITSLLRYKGLEA